MDASICSVDRPSRYKETDSYVSCNGFCVIIDCKSNTVLVLHVPYFLQDIAISLSENLLEVNKIFVLRKTVLKPMETTMVRLLFAVFSSVLVCTHVAKHCRVSRRLYSVTL